VLFRQVVATILGSIFTKLLIFFGVPLQQEVVAPERACIKVSLMIAFTVDALECVQA